MGQFETKHTAFNLTFKEHPVFKDQQIVEDSAGDVFLWIDTDSGKVSFGGKYFQIYNEQKLVQAMKNFAYIAHEFVEKVKAGKDHEQNLYDQFQKALKFEEQVTEWKKPVKFFEIHFEEQVTEWKKPVKFFEIHCPYYALIKAPDKDQAIKVYTLHEEISEVDRDYALVSFSRGAKEDKKEVPILEILKDFQSEGSAVLLIGSDVL